MVDEEYCSSLKKEDSNKRGYHICEITGEDCIAAKFNMIEGAPVRPFWSYDDDKACLCPVYNLSETSVSLVKIARLIEDRSNLSSRTREVSDMIEKETKKI